MWIQCIIYDAFIIDIVMPQKKRKSPDGKPTNELVFSSHIGTNDEVFPFVLSLYVQPGSTVADVTYGKGVFWRRVPEGVYNLLPSDLTSGVDCRHLPYEDGSIDCVVLTRPTCIHRVEAHTKTIKTTKGITKIIRRAPTRSTTRQFLTYTSLRHRKPGGYCVAAASILLNVRMRFVQINSA